MWSWSRARSRPSAAHAVAAVLCAVVVAGLVVVAVAWARFGTRDLLDAFVLTDAAIGVSFAACGAVIAFARPRNAVGWLFLAGGVGYTVAAAVFSALGLGWVPERAAPAVATVALAAWPPALTAVLGTALLLFPDGRPVSRWWWPAVGITAAWGALFTVMMVGHGEMPTVGGSGVVALHPSLGPATEAAIASAQGVLAGASLLAAVGSLVWRYVRGDATTRRRLLWVLLAGIVVVAELGLNVQSMPMLFGLTVLPAAVAIAIVRHQLLDIQLVVARVVLYGVLAGLAIGAYLGLVLVVNWLLQTRTGLAGSLVATVLVAAAFNPVRVWLQRQVDRLFFGLRDDPAALLRGLPHTGAAAGLSGTLEVVRSRLKLASLSALTAEGATVGAAPGVGGGREARVPLGPDGDVLVVGLRPGESTLSRADRSVLEFVAVPLAAALRAAQHADELARSRADVVSARGQERERLRRELHDGLGPVLTSIGMMTAAARRLLRDQPDRAAALLDGAGAETTQVTAELRRLIEELRPPVLDELSLAAAIRRRASLLVADGTTLRIDVEDEDDGGRRLRPDVESAVYRIAAEALTNVTRHANASRARVVLRRHADAVELEVTDDGASAATWVAGVGLDSMRARAAECGATLEAGATPSGGRVLLHVPTPVPERNEVPA